LRLITFEETDCFASEGIKDVHALYRVVTQVFKNNMNFE
jgi:hypothetical protein